MTPCLALCALPPAFLTLALALALLARGAEVSDAGESAQVFAAEPGFVAVQEVEDVRFVGQGAEGSSQMGDRGFAVARRIISLPCGLTCCLIRGAASAGFFDIRSLFEAPETHATPLRDGHDCNLIVFKGRSGIEFPFEGGEQAAKTRFGFAVENEGIGEQAVTGCVLRSDDFAFGRDRPGGMDGVERRYAFPCVRDRTAGFGAVRARGGDSKF